MAIDGEDQRVEFGVSKYFEYRCNTIDHGIIDGRNTVRTATPDVFSVSLPTDTMYISTIYSSIHGQ